MSSKIKCDNDNCTFKYEFFEKDEDYIICPGCGEIIKENFDKLTTLEKVQATPKIKRYKKCMSMLINLSLITLLISLAFIGIKIFKNKDYYDRRSLELKSLMRWKKRLYSLFIMGFFQPGLSESMVWKKRIGEKAYILCNSNYYRLLKLILLIIAGIATYKYILPRYILKYSNYSKYSASELVMKDDVEVYLMFIFFSFAIVIMWQIFDFVLYNIRKDLRLSKIKGYNKEKIIKK